MKSKFYNTKMKFVLLVLRSHQRNGEDAGTALFDQQMRPATHRYPVDRYLVENSKKIEMVNIINDEIWNPEPALRPEDEIILRKLHDMLQSTADDLKLLSGELSKFHEPGVQVKTMPTPLDEEFNEKVHIEEVVNAKFHGYKIVDKSSPHVPQIKPQHDRVNRTMPVNNCLQKPKITKAPVPVNPTPILKKPVVNRNLGISRTKIIQINDKSNDSINNVKLNNGKVINSAPTIAYNEFSFKYVEPKSRNNPQEALQVQHMPSINIRSELKEQKVLNLDIVPETNDNKDITTNKSNVAVVAILHKTVPKEVPVKINNPVQSSTQSNSNIAPMRIITKMSTCESDSTYNISSDTQLKLKTQKCINTVTRSLPKTSVRFARSKKSVNSKKESEKCPRLNLDEWKKKLNVVYGSSCYKKQKAISKGAVKKASSKKPTIPSVRPSVFSNSEYIPYSKLTLGGVRVSDIEREISDIPNKNNLPLSPILDRILSSRENSFSKNIPRKHKPKGKILTTSDENLLQEVIDIERTVSETLSKHVKKSMNKAETNSHNKNNDGISQNESYVDDFEDEKSDHTGNSGSQNLSTDTQSNDRLSNKCSHNNTDPGSSNNDNEGAVDKITSPATHEKIRKGTFKKTSNLSFKDSVDIFEFVHSIDTHDTATQSNTSNKIFPKETQTSPTNDEPNIHPIHNDLWPSVDPTGDVENMFKLEKDFIKKFIIDEYGDLLEKFTKPSTSNGKIEISDKNVSASQKNTQTSPAHVKSVMTSPTRTKTRTTSPFALSLPVDHQTSPLIIESTEEEHKIETENDPDLGISINLSSPRFSLRLPQNSRDVLYNLRHSQSSRIASKDHKSKVNTFRKSAISSSSSVEADYSSSEVSSLGEVKLKRRLRKKNPSISDYSSSSGLSKFSVDLQSVGILPLRSEGEVSLGQRTKELERPRESDGETRFGLLK